MNDFRSIMAQLRRTDDEVTDILTEFGYLNSKERITFDEFISLMEALEKKIIIQEKEAQSNDDDSPRSVEDGERKKYGSMLPNGVHFLPDSKVIDFLK